MGLPVNERRTLGKIDHAIAISDPQLTSLFTTFTRLSHGEHMPAGERLRARTWLLAAVLRHRLAARRRWAARRRPRSGPSRLTAWLCCPVAAGILVVTIVMTAHSGAATCTGAAPPGAGRHHVNIKTCAPAAKPPLLGGR